MDGETVGIAGFIIAILALAVGFIGWGSPTGLAVTPCPTSPPSPCWTKVQHGTFQCVASPSCVQAVTFNPAYTTTPHVKPNFNGSFVFSDQAFTTSFNAPTTTSLRFLATNGSIWNSVPRAAFTELFGLTANRETWVTPLGLLTTNQMGIFCVDMVSIGSAASTYHVEYSTDQVTWTFITGLTISPAGAGMVCTSNILLATSTFAASTTYFFRVTVKGSGLTNPIANIGSIMVQFSGLVNFSNTLNIPITCAPTYDTPTLTTVNIDVTCGDGGSVLVSALIVQVDWWAGIPA